MEELHSFITRQMKAQREIVKKYSPQLNLGDLIDKLKAIAASKEPDKLKDCDVCFDFGSAVPTTLASWRGSYSELALGYRLTGYDATDGGHFNDAKLVALITELESAIGKDFTGWKGGEFRMDRSTSVWVANPGNSDNTGIIEAVDDGWRVMLMTQYCEF
jgi:hypothetical protein